MSHQKIDALPADLSEAEKGDLEKMIGEFRHNRLQDASGEAREPLQAQVDRLIHRLADLSEWVLATDRQMAAMAEVMRLSHQKSELLNQRLDTVIAALKKGRMI
ncbi:MAG: hypothetical protein V2I40_07975 [Desulfobacteraceae bacterium]|jgi:hypothetical protein|nr:hypothetical protein [Desulfobacteraceae bacterium]